MAALGTLARPAVSQLHGAVEELQTAVKRVASCIRAADAADLGEGLIRIREVGIDPLEAAFANGLRRFDKSGEFKADGALSAVAWVRERCNLSAGAAAERVTVARQLETLPQIAKALATGGVGFQHVALIARTAENLGSGPVQKEETNLLQAAKTMDPGRFAAVAKGFEHRVDAAAALTEANHAYQRRYLHISEPQDGMVRLDGILDLEGGATLKTALNALMPPPTNDDGRTPGQRRVDALVDLARRPLDGSKLGTVGGQRPHLIITASAETLAGVPGAPPPEMTGVGPIPIETAQRHACDPTVSWLLGHAELESETASDAHRQIPAAPAGRWSPAIATASSTAVTGRRSGATGTTWSGGRVAGRRSCPTWRLSAGAIIACSMKKAGRWSEQKMVAGGRYLQRDESRPTPGRPDSVIAP